MHSLQDLKAIYEKLKFSARCIDVEWSGGKDGTITVIGSFRPENGPVEGYIGLVQGKDLTPENLKAALAGCKLLITFNGTYSDLPSIEKEFPGCLPRVPHLDLYLVAKQLNLDFGLKLLEKHYGIYRRPEVEDKRRVAVKWWKLYHRKKNPRFLELLLAYNREDTINLYMLAEALMKEVGKNKS